MKRVTVLGLALLALTLMVGVRPVAAQTLVQFQIDVTNPDPNPASAFLGPITSAFPEGGF
jgi:hypothetical protein